MSNEEVHIAGRSPAAIELEPGKKYAFCVCGRSQGQPFCDGSHKETPFTLHVFTAESSENKWFCMCKHTKNVPYCDSTHKTLVPAGVLVAMPSVGAGGPGYRPDVLSTGCVLIRRSNRNLG